MPSHVGGIDIGGTKVAAIVAGESGPLARRVMPTPKSGPIDTLPEQAIALLRQACQDAGVAESDLGMVGVSSCGPFVKDGGLIGLATPNICGAHSPGLPNDWEVIPLEAGLRRHLPAVRIENDCVAALVAERTFGAVVDEPDCVYVTWSTGIGFGFCVDGHVLRGKNGNAGHAGHMLISERQDAICGCGNRGDVEGLIAGRNLGDRLGMPTAELFAAARAGDAAALAHVHEAARWFGRALYDVTTCLDTRQFVIGGSVWLHHGEWLAPLVSEEIRRHFPALTDGVELRMTKLGNLVADLGALCLVLPDDWISAWRGTQPWSRLAPLPG
ncbi:ROK family protein [Noviherbaspirillum sp. 17J57-3]|uniref:ROK family protein n=2 Tax=Noviherbaspirillum galbum TaxID=2709383 RepID=A0A6B3SNB5_9BURK|nr:ROK family protein [Noviherbaspirillum galbum]